MYYRKKDDEKEEEKEKEREDLTRTGTKSDGDLSKTAVSAVSADSPNAVAAVHVQ